MTDARRNPDATDATADARTSRFDAPPAEHVHSRYAPAPPPPGPQRSGTRWLPFVAAGALVVAAVAVILVLTVFSSSDDGAATYEQKLDAVMRPVVSANERLSRTLQGLHGTKSSRPRRAVRAAQSATLTARGGLGALTVPDGSEQLAVNARGTLTRESAYLGAVNAALAHPGRGTASQTQTLASNLTDALNAIAPAQDDWAQSVTGADKLTSWAPKAAAKVRRHERAAARRRRAAGSDTTSSSTTSSSTASTAAPTVSGGTDCGGGLNAGPNTSCPFAENVREAYDEAPGASATVRVFSPVTGDTYTMSCAPAGSGVTCSGANNASVTWSY